MIDTKAQDVYMYANLGVSLSMWFQMLFYTGSESLFCHSNS